MREIDISDFQIRSGELLEEVNKTNSRLVVTRGGKPIVEIVPAGVTQQTRNFLGSGIDTFDILDSDIVGPIIDFK
jgi:prevent-host-death family protein